LLNLEKCLAFIPELAKKKKKKSSGQKICDRNGFIGVRLSINLQSITNAYIL